MSDSQRYKPTFILIALNIAVYIYTSVAGGNFLVTSNNMLDQWGQVNYYVFNGVYYQLFTSMFVHATIVHITGNLFFLLIFGLRGEEMFSLPEFLSIYLLGGLAGNLLSLVMGPDFASVGASGAIFALFGACVVYDRRSLGQSIIGALIYAFFLFIISAGPETNYLAHLGGLGTGLLMGYVLALRRRGNVRYRVSYSYRRGPLFLVYGRVRASILTLVPSLRFRCFLRQTGAMSSRTETS
jgi:rhomboid protease GluP